MPIGSQGLTPTDLDAMDNERLAEAVRVVHAGESLLSPAATTALIRHFQAAPTPPAGPRSTTIPAFSCARPSSTA